MATSTNTLLNNTKSLMVNRLPALVTEEGLTAITLFLRHEPLQLVSHQLPMVWVGLDRSTRSDDPKDGASMGRNGGSYGGKHRLMIGVATKNSDPETVSVHLSAYTDLIREAMEIDTWPSTSPKYLIGQDHVMWANWQETEWRPPVNLDNLYGQEAILYFEVNRRRSVGAR